MVIGILSSIVSTLGLIGNILSLIILSRRFTYSTCFYKITFSFFRSKSSIFHHLLSCLCAADILFLISNLLALPFHFGIRNTIINFFFPFFESCCHFAYSASIFFIVAVTIDRWQAVCFPYWYQVGITNLKLNK